GPDGRHIHNPTLYVGEWVYGLWYLLLRMPRGRPMVKAALSRLDQSVEVLEAAQQNLREVPALWLKIAKEEVRGYLQFLPVIQKELSRISPEKRTEIKKVAKRAEEVAHHFIRHLSKLQRGAPKDFAVGEKRYNFLLKHYHHYDLTATGLMRLGKRYLDIIEEKLERQAASIDPKRPWVKLVQDIKKKHPSRKKLLSIYREELRRLKGFLKRKDLVSFPRVEQLRVVETPVFSRSTVPFAAYIDPPMFSGANRGTFFVTPPAGKSKKAIEESLSEHSFASLRVTALHEGYPGHHLQFAIQKLSSRILPRIYHCSSFYEGWSLYCEEMMYENGYYDEETRLLQLRDQLWRACRVLIDVGLQTKALSYGQAVNFLSTKTQMSPAGAAGDVNWYSMSPTVPQSYLTGMLKILSLREKMKNKEGSNFSLKKFHDRLLKNGAIPLALAEVRMGLA
ncbi:MAG: DUF885 domain-containing protein, partial [bacterium]|nr:DUF885 domain-containing protein [bacterium]